MSRYLMIDIGAGTMDILCFDAETGEHFKAVVPSPVRHVATQIEQTQGPLAVSGVEMGGGPVTQALRKRAEQEQVVISVSAAATLHHCLDKVRSWGLEIAADQEIAQLQNESAFTPIELADVQPERIEKMIDAIGWPMDFQVVALCAQDHGVPPKGVSHLDFRHNLFQRHLDKSPFAHTLLFDSSQIPVHFNRLRALARSAAKLNAQKIYVMDSGMAAILGASLDVQALNASPKIVLDIATSHTVAAVLQGNELAGFVEYHTQDIILSRLETLIHDLADGNIDHAQILAEGGHGAYLNRTVHFANIQRIIATGPKRSLAADSRLPISWGAPWGDNMMTGTVGLLEAVRQRMR